MLEYGRSMEEASLVKLLLFFLPFHAMWVSSWVWRFRLCKCIPSKYINNHPQVVSKHQVTLSLTKASWDVVWSEISAHNFMLGLYSVFFSALKKTIRKGMNMNMLEYLESFVGFISWLLKSDCFQTPKISLASKLCFPFILSWIKLLPPGPSLAHRRLRRALRLAESWYWENQMLVETFSELSSSKWHVCFHLAPIFFLMTQLKSCHSCTQQGMAAKPSIHACSFGTPPDPDKITTYPGVARRLLGSIDRKDGSAGKLGPNPGGFGDVEAICLMKLWSSTGKRFMPKERPICLLPF